MLVESTNTISKTEIASAKYDDVDVIYVTRETLYEVYDQMMAYKTMWRSVNLLFHGSADLEDQSISIFGMKMSMNRNIMMNDPQVKGMIRFIKAISLMAHESIYIYTCAVGIVDGLKELCIHLDDSCGLKNGIFLSTDNTGNPPSGNWRIEWGTKRGFLVEGLHDNEIEHAQNDLFSDLSGLTFTLSNEGSTTDSTTDSEMVNIQLSDNCTMLLEHVINTTIKPNIFQITQLTANTNDIKTVFMPIVSFNKGIDTNAYPFKQTNDDELYNFNTITDTNNIYIACDINGNPILGRTTTTEGKSNGLCDINRRNASIKLINGKLHIDNTTFINEWHLCVVSMRWNTNLTRTVGEVMKSLDTHITVFSPNGNGSMYKFNPKYDSDMWSPILGMKQSSDEIAGINANQPNIVVIVIE